MIAKLTVQADGSLVIPSETLSALRIEAGTELLVAGSQDRIVLWRLGDLSPRIQRLVQEFHNLGGSIKGTDLFIGDVTVDAYLQMAEVEQDRLWERLWEEEHKKVKEGDEVEIGREFVSAQQRRSPEGR